MQDSKLPIESNGFDSQYECPICLTCLKDPILTSCGHRFCTACLNMWLENRGSCCPVDGGELNKESDLFPDHFTRREILKQKTKCKTCKLEMSISEIDEHMLTHLKNESESVEGHCPFRAIGCKMIVREEELKEHLTKDINMHLNLIITSQMMLIEKMKNSDKISDALAQESLMWEPQSKGKEHQNASLMRALYERVVVLEQRCHEQNAQIQKLKTEQLSSQLKINDLSLLHSSGHYLWNITEFTKKLAAMKSDNKRLYFSEGFYTSPIGYKICGRINLSSSNNDQLSLLIHLMKTPHDYALDWPFTGRIHLTLIHPTNPDLSVKETMMTRPDLESLKRPHREMNTKAFGYPQFVSIYDILTNGFLIDDTLIVKIHIQRI